MKSIFKYLWLPLILMSSQVVAGPQPAPPATVQTVTPAIAASAVGGAPTPPEVAPTVAPTKAGSATAAPLVAVAVSAPTPTPAKTDQQNNESRNWDLIKLIVGSFSGAALAFLVARVNDARKLRRENLAAANLALLTLRDQINDFLSFRKQFRHDVANPARGPASPIYMLSHPYFFTFAESSIDFSSLTFLMEQRKHVPKLNSLVFSAKLYRHLVKLAEMHTESVLALQEKLAAVENTNPARTAKEIEAAAGPLLIANATSAITALAVHTRDDEPVYRQAVSELREAIIDTLGPWWWPNRLLKRFPKFVKGPALISFTFGDPDVQEDALPPWPKKLWEAITEQGAPKDEKAPKQQSTSFSPKYEWWRVTYTLSPTKVA